MVFSLRGSSLNREDILKMVMRDDKRGLQNLLSVDGVRRGILDRGKCIHKGMKV